MVTSHVTMVTMKVSSSSYILRPVFLSWTPYFLCKKQRKTEERERKKKLWFPIDSLSSFSHKSMATKCYPIISSFFSPWLKREFCWFHYWLFQNVAESDCFIWDPVGCTVRLGKAVPMTLHTAGYFHISSWGWRHKGRTKETGTRIRAG